MSVSRLARLAVIAPAVMLLAAVLGSCGGATPGVAAEVGEDTITIDEVDQLAGDVCAVQESLPDDAAAPGAQATSGLTARDGALQSLVLRSIADQMADDYGLTTDQDYQAQVDQARLQFTGVDEEKVEAALPAYTAIPYFINIMRQVGERNGAATGDEALTEGVRQAQDWQADNPIRTNPMFGSFNIGDQEIESERDDLSFPASSTAKDAEGGSADYFASLPESQRCG
ncbi:MAG TPA: hypothetical protein VFY58_11370 [Nocardioides sp.]|nr:hypothetical protein [Nocardioides sp.]